jgi:cytochrome c-type biogenesis protein CcmH/NrfF
MGKRIALWGLVFVIFTMGIVIVGRRLAQQQEQATNEAAKEPKQ